MLLAEIPKIYSLHLLLLSPPPSLYQQTNEISIFLELYLWSVGSVPETPASLTHLSTHPYAHATLSVALL